MADVVKSPCEKQLGSEYFQELRSWTEKSTGLETPLLGWALPLTILNHVSLGVGVPVFFHPGDVASSSYFFSLFRYTLNGYLIHYSITNLLVINALLFDLGSTQSQSSDCAGFCPPLPFCQDRAAVGPTAQYPS